MGVFFGADYIRVKSWHESGMCWEDSEGAGGHT